MATEPERPMPRARSPTLEGGDVLVPRRDLLLVGVTERTNKAGVEALHARRSRKQKPASKTVIIVEIPRQRSFMHLDTIFTFINRHECLIYPPVILPSGSQAAKVTTVDLTKKRSVAYTRAEVAARRAEEERASISSRSTAAATAAVDQQREQWTDGANAFALAPGIILLYERNVRTAEELAQARLSHRLRRRSAPRAHGAGDVDGQKVRAADRRQ